MFDYEVHEKTAIFDAFCNKKTHILCQLLESRIMLYFTPCYCFATEKKRALKKE